MVFYKYNRPDMIRKITDFLEALASYGKVLLKSGRPSAAGLVKGERLIVMGNGPSLRESVSDYGDLLGNSKTLAVNFAANTPEFYEIRPSLYVLADPHFFKVEPDGKSKDANVVRLWDNLISVSWPMTLYVPCGTKIPVSIEKNKDISLKRFNMTPGEGHRGLVHGLYRKGLAMPRPRNVLIASLMIALREGYRDIAIVGADHTWSRDLKVDDLNHVVSVQKHFYEDSKKEEERVYQEYTGYHLHDILDSLRIAFRSYHQIAAFAATLGARIVNCTPGSFIDAFPREKLQKN